MKEVVNKFFFNLADLFKVKTILSLSVILTTCILTIKGVISTESFMVIAGSIITYYFTRSEGT